nr:hypothetical protein [Ructibacterium gallinarum]
MNNENAVLLLRCSIFVVQNRFLFVSVLGVVSAWRHADTVSEKLLKMTSA